MESNKMSINQKRSDELRQLAIKYASAAGVIQTDENYWKTVNAIFEYMDKGIYPSWLNIPQSPGESEVGVIGNLIERLTPLSKSGSITAKDGVTTISFLMERDAQALLTCKAVMLSTSWAWCYSVAKKGELMELSVHICSAKEGGQNG